MDERVVDAEAAGPEQHGALEQRGRDGADRGGGGRVEEVGEHGDWQRCGG